MIELTVTQVFLPDGATRYRLAPECAAFGACGASGVDTLHFTLPASWAGLTVRVTFHPGAGASGTAPAPVAAVLDAAATVPLTAAITAADGALVLDAVGQNGYAAYSAGCRYRVYAHPAAGGGSTALTPSEYQQFAAATAADRTAAETAAQSAAAAAKTAVHGTPVYCWGDSLTFGAGGDISGWHVNDYPRTLAQLCGQPVVNLGVQGESTVTVMARQGADPLTVPACTIPVDCAPVTVGTLAAGLKTASGARAKPLHLGAAGVNPCTLAGVRGTLSLSGTSDDTRVYTFTRETPGSAVPVVEGAELETYAMAHFTDGIAVFWAGANGGWNGSITTYIAQLRAMAAAYAYKDYLVLLLRETTVESDLAAFRTAFGEHFLYLLPLLQSRGLAEAAILSSDSTLKNGVPAQLDSGDGLHLNFYGYPVVGRFVFERLLECGAFAAAPADTAATGDAYGAFLYKLPQKTYLTGRSYVDTRVRLYKDVSAAWTVVCAFEGVLGCAAGYPYSLLCCLYDGVNKGLTVRRSGDEALTVMAGASGVRMDYATEFSGKAYSEIEHAGGRNVVVIAKDAADNYSIYLNGYRAYNSPLCYTLAQADAPGALHLIAGARWNADGTAAEYLSSFTLDDLRVYDGALADDAVRTLTAALLAQS